MNPAYLLAQVVLEVSKLHEQSYDKIAADAATSNTPEDQIIDYGKFYTKTLEQVAEEVCCTPALKDLAIPAYLLLFNSWTEAVEWAASVMPLPTERG